MNNKANTPANRTKKRGLLQERLTLTLVTFAFILTTSVFVYFLVRKSVHAQDEARLGGLLNSKATEVYNWLWERKGDSMVASHLPKLLEHTEALKQNKTLSPAEQRDILGPLQVIQKTYIYGNAAVSSKNGKIVAATPKKEFGPFTEELIQKVIRTGELGFSPLYRNSGELLLDLSAPIRKKSEDNRGPVLGATLFQIKPDNIVFPILSHWEPPFKTADLLLLFQQDHHAFVMNQPRLAMEKNGITFPLDPEYAGANEILNGTDGPVKGIDYRGEQVVGRIRRIQGTDWFLLSKMDEKEERKLIFASVFEFVGVFILLGAFITGILISWYRLKSSKKLRISEERLRFAQVLANLATWEWDLSLGSVEWSGVPYRVLGLHQEETLPETYSSLMERVHPGDVADLKLGIESLLRAKNGLKFKMEHRLVSDKGNTIHVEHHVYRLSQSGTDERSRIIGTIQDVTSRKLLEQKLTQAIATAENETRSKSQFLANVSHELRTPMNVISGLVHLAAKSDSDQKRREYLHKISIASKNLNAITNDLLDFTKIESGKLTIEETGFNLDELGNYVKTILAQKASEKSLALTFSISPRIPRDLVGDPLRLGQVLVNLGGNAVKFTQFGGVDIRIELANTQPGASAIESVRLLFSVTDTGIGISKSQMERLFKSFSQADASTSRKYGGTGLGLAISKELVELMGGTPIVAESTEGEGSKFSFSLELPVMEPKELTDLEKESLPLIGARILVVDDHEINQLVSFELLEAAGCNVTALGSGKNAIIALQQFERKFDVVLMDLQMPEMDGFETTRAIRKIPRLQSIPIIAMTALGISENFDKCQEAGMNDFVTKPIDPDKLLETVRKWTKWSKIAEATRFEDSDVFTPSEALERLNGNYTMLVKLLKTFKTLYGNYAQDIRRTLEQGNPDEAERMVHGLKGIAGNLSAKKIFRASEKIEFGFREGNEERNKGLLVELDETIHEFMRLIEPMIQLG